MLGLQLNLLGDAVRAVNRGLWLFPCNPSGTVNPENETEFIDKQPHLLRPGAPYKIRWGETATNDLNQIVQMWTWSPEANLGVACLQSNILVVDCDIPKVEGQLNGTDYEYLHGLLNSPLIDGETVYDAVCQKYGGNWEECMDTYSVATGSGGLHLYYRWPLGVQASQGSIVKGILDIRCNGGTKGGYVLGAGSETTKGAYVQRNNKPIRPAPQWLVELCTERPRPVRPKTNYSQPRNSNFGGLTDAIKTAVQGNRNAALFWAVRAMYGDGAKEQEIEDLLGPAATEVGLSDSEIRDTIRSGCRLQAHKDG